MKKILSTILFAGFTILSFSQQKDSFISFDFLLHDFGLINENDGIVTVKFGYKNAGGTPLIINDVKVSCGCTKPKFTREPILPGERNYIEIGFNPKNRQGPFNYKITVLSNALNKQAIIQIKGTVKGSLPESYPKQPSIVDKYKFQLGDIMATTNHVTFPKINFDDTLTKSVEIFNPNDTSIIVTCKNIPKHITTKVVPEILQPGDTGKIDITYYSRLKNDWGFVFDRVTLAVNDDITKGGMLTVTANITEDFDNFTPEQRANAPVIAFVNQNQSFDTIYQNTKVTLKFEFENKGKSDLIIRKVKPSCGCTASNAGDNIIKPGKKSFINAEFSAGSRKGHQNKSITVISNDPVNSSVVIKFSGVVIPKEN